MCPVQWFTGSPHLVESSGIFIGKFPGLSWKVLEMTLFLESLGNLPYLQCLGKSWNFPGNDAEGSFWIEIDRLTPGTFLGRSYAIKKSGQPIMAEYCTLVQGHSRSLTVVAFESLYMTSY